MSAERDQRCLAMLMTRFIAAVLLFVSAGQLRAQNSLPPDCALSFGCVLLNSRALILSSYSGLIYYKGEGYNVTATVTKGNVVCQGTFRTDAMVSPIQGKGKLDLEMALPDSDGLRNKDYRFTLHCPFPGGFANQGSVEELAHSYSQPGGAVDFDTATCTPVGRPKPGFAGPCRVVWPEVLKGQWSDTTGDAVLFMSWALCQKQCPTPPPPPP